MQLELKITKYGLNLFNHTNRSLFRYYKALPYDIREEMKAIYKSKSLGLWIGETLYNEYKHYQNHGEWLSETKNKIPNRKSNRW